MGENDKIKLKISQYLNGGKTIKKTSKVIAHIYPDILVMRDDGYSWEQILHAINDNECNFTIKRKTFDSAIFRIRKNGVKIENQHSKKSESPKRNAFASIAEKKERVKHDNNPDLDQLINSLMNPKADDQSSQSEDRPKNPLAALSKNARVGDYNPTPDKKRIYGDQSDA